MTKKISVIGAGSVGSGIAQTIVHKELADVILLDIKEGLPQGRALDLLESLPLVGSDSKIKGTNLYEDTADSDIIVITAGFPRTEDMSRNELLSKNTDIIKAVTKEVAKFSPHAHLIVVTNPLDIMCYVALKVSGFPKTRVMGMAGILDSARFRAFIGMELDVSVKDIQTLVIGAHNDTMVPLPRYSSISGIPITELLSSEEIKKVVERTKNAGDKIVKLLKTGSSFYSPVASVVQMIETIIKDKKRIFPCSVYLEGEYGVKGYFFGVPVKLGANGIEQIIELKLNKEEKTYLKESVKSVQSASDKIVF